MAKKSRSVVPCPQKASVSAKKSRKQKTATISIKTQPPVQLKNDTAINTPTNVGQSEIISLASTPSPDMDVQKNLRKLDGEKLGEYIEGKFGGVCTTLCHLQPLIEEMKQRFDLLPRGRRTDGTYATIRGCRSFKEWVENRLHRTARAVYYLLAGGNPQNKQLKLARRQANQAKEEQQRGTPEKVSLTVEGAQEEMTSGLVARWKEAFAELKTTKAKIDGLRDDVHEDTDNSGRDFPAPLNCLRLLDSVIRHLGDAIRDAEGISFPGGSDVVN